MKPTLLERFWAKVNKDGPTRPHMTTPCWLWTAWSIRGYGAISVNAKTVLAHRFSWAEVNGPVPAGMGVLHRCDNPSCVRVDHLFVGTALDNARDRDAKGRTGKACGEKSGAHRHPEKMPRGERHWKAKLTTEQVAEVRALRAHGASRRSIASRFGISDAHVSSIALRKAWAHIPAETINVVG